MAGKKEPQEFEPSDVSVEIETIDSAKAGDYLATAAKVTQRILNPDLVEFYASEMRKGQWRLNGESIKFDKRGRLRDGQHRLNAVIVANAIIRVRVVRELDDADVDTVDTGRKRSPGDVLRMHGYGNANQLAAALHVKALYDLDALSDRKWISFSPKDLETVLADNPGIEDCLAGWNTREMGKVLLTASWRAFLRYEMRRIDRDAADEFEEKLYLGVGLTPDDPIFKLRQRLLVNSTKEGRAKMQPVEVGALIVKVWNEWRKGISTRQLLIWRRSAEPFPKFDELPS